MKKIFIILGIIAILAVIVTAQVMTVPIIPNSFIISSPPLPLPIEGEYFGNVPFETNQMELSYYIEKNELLSPGIANMTYIIRCHQPHHDSQIRKSFTYSVLADPIQSLQIDINQVVPSLINVPQSPQGYLGVGVSI